MFFLQQFGNRQICVTCVNYLKLQKIWLWQYQVYLTILTLKEYSIPHPIRWLVLKALNLTPSLAGASKRSKYHYEYLDMDYEIWISWYLGKRVRYIGGARTSVSTVQESWAGGTCPQGFLKIFFIFKCSTWWFHFKAVCVVLASLIIIILTKLLYDYWQYRYPAKTSSSSSRYLQNQAPWETSLDCLQDALNSEYS